MTDYLVHSTPVVGPTHPSSWSGAYPHLEGGEGRLSRHAKGMRQLSSPAHSARDLTTWLITNLDDPTKPLSTVSLLLSERTPMPFRNPLTGEMRPVGVPTMDNVKEALRAWKSRAANDEDRVLFYFCGHGLGGGNELRAPFSA